MRINGARNLPDGIFVISLRLINIFKGTRERFVVAI